MLKQEKNYGRNLKNLWILNLIYDILNNIIQ